MAPKKALPKSVAAAEELGLKPMTSFFDAAAVRGRPKLKKSNAGRPSAVEKALPPAPAAAKQAAATAAPATAAPAPQKYKQKRKSWSKGPGLEEMSAAVAAWGLEVAKPKKDRVSMTRFAAQRQIPLTVLQTHVTSNDEKRIKVGDGPGKKPLISDDIQKVIVDCLVRRDRGNQGLDVTGSLDLLEEVAPHLTRKKLESSWRRTVRPKYSERLTKPTAAQVTTTKRTAITPAQQWRWHKVHQGER